MRLFVVVCMAGTSTAAMNVLVPFAAAAATTLAVRRCFRPPLLPPPPIVIVVDFFHRLTAGARAIRPRLKSLGHRHSRLVPPSLVSLLLAARLSLPSSVMREGRSLHRKPTAEPLALPKVPRHRAIPPPIPLKQPAHHKIPNKADSEKRQVCSTSMHRSAYLPGAGIVGRWVPLLGLLGVVRHRPARLAERLGGGLRLRRHFCLWLSRSRWRTVGKEKGKKKMSCRRRANLRLSIQKPGPNCCVKFSCGCA